MQMNKDKLMFHISITLLIYGIVFILLAFHNIDNYQNMLRMAIYEQFNPNDYVENNLLGNDIEWTDVYLNGLWIGMTGIFQIFIGSYFLGVSMERIYKPKNILK